VRDPTICRRPLVVLETQVEKDNGALTSFIFKKVVRIFIPTASSNEIRLALNY